MADQFFKNFNILGNEHLSLSFSMESDSDTPISFRSSLSVRFLVKVKFLSCVSHFWLDNQDALRDRKIWNNDATKVYSPTLTFLDASL